MLWMYLLLVPEKNDLAKAKTMQLETKNVNDEKNEPLKLEPKK